MIDPTFQVVNVDFLQIDPMLEILKATAGAVLRLA
jgi:hypothetical protein